MQAQNFIQKIQEFVSKNKVALGIIVLSLGIVISVTFSLSQSQLPEKNGAITDSPTPTVTITPTIIKTSATIQFKNPTYQSGMQTFVESDDHTDSCSAMLYNPAGASYYAVLPTRITIIPKKVAIQYNKEREYLEQIAITRKTTPLGATLGKEIFPPCDGSTLSVVSSYDFPYEKTDASLLFAAIGPELPELDYGPISVKDITISLFFYAEKNDSFLRIQERVTLDTLARQQDIAQCINNPTQTPKKYYDVNCLAKALKASTYFANEVSKKSALLLQQFELME